MELKELRINQNQNDKRKIKKMGNKKKNAFEEAFDIAYDALIEASFQLEQCGWCPKAENNKLETYFKICPVAIKEGVSGCHWCMSDVFFKQAVLDKWYFEMSERSSLQGGK